ncbi:hypothetical protein ACIQM0_15300 [Streptomyces sp. NPDC091387]|uniref:hypothetical protein n=1 Tax=Streptomyces sp. NPDC091387 TaxID=3365998 RepID=UPI0037F720E0
MARAMTQAKKVAGWGVAGISRCSSPVAARALRAATTAVIAPPAHSRAVSTRGRDGSGGT